MARPLMQLGVGELTELFQRSRSDQRVLKQLENELRHRQVPKAVALLTEVQSVLYMTTSTPSVAVSAPSVPIASVAPLPAKVLPTSAQPTLWDAPAPMPSRAINVPAPAATKESAPKAASTGTNAATSPSDKQAPSTTRPVVRPPVAMSVADAYKLLKATPASTWDSIEKTRRELVSLSSPARTDQLQDGEREKLLTEASAVNSASQLVYKARLLER